MSPLEAIAIVYGAQPIAVSDPEPGLKRRVLAFSDKLMLVEHYMKKGWTGAAHSHPHEQVVYVVAGRLRVKAAGRDFEVGNGDSFVVGGGVEHQASALEDSHVLDVFSPRREDY